MLVEGRLTRRRNTGGMLGYEIAAPVAMLVLYWALSFLFGHFRLERLKARIQRDAFDSTEQFIASIRLRVPPGAEFVVLGHQMCFNDVRNRAAVEEILEKNNFTVSAAETYEKGTTYWLLAKRSAVIDRAPDEVRTVSRFVTSYGGRYERCAPEL